MTRLRRAAERELCADALVERTLDRQEWDAVQARLSSQPGIGNLQQGMAPWDPEAGAPSRGQAGAAKGPIKP
jgi:hypothetical protein